MTKEELQEENKLLRKILLQREKDIDEMLIENKENRKYKELYWNSRARQDEGE